MSKRLLSISHSYVVGLNRAVPNAIARAGWDVTVVAPPFFPDELRPLTLAREQEDIAAVEPVPLRIAAEVHVMTWGSRLRRLLDDEWDIVHVWEEPYVLAGAQVARWRRSGALVFATFQNIRKRYPPPFNWIERYAMSCADGWIAFGETVQHALQTRSGYDALPHRVISPGVDLQRFAPSGADRRAVRRELRFTEDDCVVGFAGRFVPEKGLELLMAALDRVDEPWKLLLVGSGPLERPLRRWAAAFGGRVQLATDVAHPQMARYLNAMDVLAVPSRTTARWREQFGRVIVEAMACGVPVIGSDSGEVPHVIGDAGLIAPEGQTDAWAESLTRVVRDADLRRELSQRGRCRAQVFGADVVARKQMAFFEELLAQPARGARR